MVTVQPVRAFEDNYIWLIHNGAQAAVVDPGEAEPVLAALQQHSLRPCAILVTHRHSDHVDGIEALLQHYSVPVYGPRHPLIPNLTHQVSEGDIIAMPELSLSLAVLAVPGHTTEHLAYYGGNLLFCGDTLFACGCGRIFDGTPQQMYASLQKLANLPEATQVYCAHEYTLSSIRFAMAVEPGNSALLKRKTEDDAKVAAGQPTVPSTIALEKLTNPFLRCHVPEITQSASLHNGKTLSDPVEVFTEIRAWKNTF